MIIMESLFASGLEANPLKFGFDRLEQLDTGLGERGQDRGSCGCDVPTTTAGHGDILG